MPKTLARYIDDYGFFDTFCTKFSRKNLQKTLQKPYSLTVLIATFVMFFDEKIFSFLKNKFKNF